MKIKSYFKNKLKINNFGDFFIFFIKYFFLISFSIILIFPFYFMIISSLKDDQEISSLKFIWFPKRFSFLNFIEVFNTPEINFFKYLLNTIIMVFISTILGTIISIVTAFALSVLSFRSKKTIFALFSLGMMINSETLLLTNFRTVSDLNMVNIGNNSTIFFGVYLAMILPFLVDIFHIFLLKQNAQKIPRELYYASKVDGTSDLNYLLKVWIPILKPVIFTTVIFRFVSAWNAYMWPELVGGELLTNMMRKKMFDADSEILKMNVQMALSFLIVLPLILIFFFCKKYIISGELKSGIKG